ARPRGGAPFEHEAAVRAVHEELLLSSFEDPAGQEEVDEAVPSLRGALQSLDGRDEVLRLDEVGDGQVGKGIDDDDRVARILIEERDQLFQEVRRRKIEGVLLMRPRSRDDAVTEVGGREILEHRPVAERSIVISVEGSRELLKDDFLRTGESHVADALREVGAGRASTLKTALSLVRAIPIERTNPAGSHKALL